MRCSINSICLSNDYFSVSSDTELGTFQITVSVDVKGSSASSKRSLGDLSKITCEKENIKSESVKSSESVKRRRCAEYQIQHLH